MNNAGITPELCFNPHPRIHSFASTKAPTIFMYRTRTTANNNQNINKDAYSLTCKAYTDAKDVLWAMPTNPTVRSGSLTKWSISVYKISIINSKPQTKNSFAPNEKPCERHQSPTYIKEKLVWRKLMSFSHANQHMRGIDATHTLNAHPM